MKDQARKTAALAAAAVALFGAPCEAHSWLDCIDWTQGSGVTDGTCAGYPRNWAAAKPEPFGQDVGRENRPGAGVTAGGLVCGARGFETPNANPADGYSSQYPMARMSTGQEYEVRWPAKNHANVGTQRGVQMFISKTADGGDDFSHVEAMGLDAYVQDCANNGGICQQTFSQNIHNAGECSSGGVDKTPCINKFKVPNNLNNGIYTFMWWWEFNAGEYYNSCADVLITGGGSGGGGGDSGGGESSNCDEDAANQCSSDYWTTYWNNAYVTSHDAQGQEQQNLNPSSVTSQANCDGLETYANCLSAADCCSSTVHTTSYNDAKRLAQNEGACEELPKCGSSSSGAKHHGGGGAAVAAAVSAVVLIGVAGGIYYVRHKQRGGTTSNATAAVAQTGAKFSRPPTAAKAGKVTPHRGRIQRPAV